MKAHPGVLVLIAMSADLLFAQTTQPSSQGQQAAARAAANAPVAAAKPPSLVEMQKAVAHAISALHASTANAAEPSIRRLDELVEQAGLLVGQTADPSTAVRASHLQLQVYYALARHAHTHNQTRDMAYRVGQLRDATWRVRNVKSPSANTIGRFWHLQANLFDMNRETGDRDARQQHAIEELERFLRASGAHVQTQAPGSANLHREAQLALLQLYDQQGDVRQVGRLVEKLAPQMQRDERRWAQVQRSFGYAAQLGRPFDFKDLEIAGAGPGHDYRGKVVLIHFWADWHNPSVVAFDELGRVYGRHKDQGLEIVSVTIDPSQFPGAPSDAAPPRPPEGVAWRIYRAGPLAQARLYRTFSVNTVPRYLLIDAEGKVASVAGSLAILKRLGPLLESAGKTNAASPSPRPAVAAETQPADSTPPATEAGPNSNE